MHSLFVSLPDLSIAGRYRLIGALADSFLGDGGHVLVLVPSATAAARALAAFTQSRSGNDGRCVIAATKREAAALAGESFSPQFDRTLPDAFSCRTELSPYVNCRDDLQ